MGGGAGWYCGGEAIPLLGTSEEAVMVLDALRGYVQLASGLTEVTKQKAQAAAKALLQQTGADSLSRADQQGERADRRDRCHQQEQPSAPAGDRVERGRGRGRAARVRPLRGGRGADPPGGALEGELAEPRGTVRRCAPAGTAEDDVLVGRCRKKAAKKGPAKKAAQEGPAAKKAAKKPAKKA